MSSFRMLTLAIVLTCSICPSASFAELEEASMLSQARTHYQENNYYFASTWLERVLKKFPKTPQREEVLVMLSKSFAATGRDAKAVQTLKTLLQEYPNAGSKVEPGVLRLVEQTASQSEYAMPLQEAPEEPAAAPASAAAAPDPAKPVAVKAEAPAPVVAAAPAPAPETKPAQAIVPEPTKIVSAPSAPVAKPAAVQAEAQAPVVAAAPAPAPATKPVPVQVVPESPKTVAASSAPIAKPAAVKAEAPAPVVAAVAASVSTTVLNPAKTVAITTPAAAVESADGAVYTLKFGDYVLKPSMAEIEKKIKSAGLVPVIEPGPRKTQLMIRIHVGEFADQKGADKMLQKLRKAKAEHFALKDKRGRLHVYAGSYFNPSGAVDEQIRLSDCGINSEQREVSVTVPTFLVSAGSFASQEAAARKVAELEPLGVKPLVVQRLR